MKRIIESPKRSLFKSITYRGIVLLSDTLIASIVTGQIAEAIGIVFFTNVFSTFLYYIHERIWTDFDWLRDVTGKQSRPIIKSISYRILTVLSDFVVAGFITGNLVFSLNIILFTNIGSTVLYYIHEVIWNRIVWGERKISK
jgi:uncharacterized membrane protein